MRHDSIIKCSLSSAEATAASSSTKAANIISSSESKASANHRTPRVQGGGDAAAELPGGTTPRKGGGRRCLAWWCTDLVEEMVRWGGAAQRRSTGGGRGRAVEKEKKSSTRRQGWPAAFLGAASDPAHSLALGFHWVRRMKLCAALIEIQIWGRDWAKFSASAPPYDVWGRGRGERGGGGASGDALTIYSNTCSIYWLSLIILCGGVSCHSMCQ
jgi:hypothetical protein